MPNVTIEGNRLGSVSWDGRNGEWYTGDGLSGHWEDLQCDRFLFDMDNYLAGATSRYKSVSVSHSSLELITACTR